MVLGVEVYGMGFCSASSDSHTVFDSCQMQKEGLKCENEQEW